MSDRDATGSGDDLSDSGSSDDPSNSGSLDDPHDSASPGDGRTTTQSGDESMGEDRSVHDSTGERDEVNSEWVDQVERVESVERVEDGDEPVVAVESEDGPAGDEEEPGLMAALFGASGEDAPPTPTIERESPRPENVLFVALGVMLALFVLYRLWTIGAA